MNDEWFKDARNENAATKESLELFNKAKKPKRLKLISIFLDKYKLSYLDGKIRLESISTPDELSRELSNVVAVISNSAPQVSRLDQNGQADRVGSLLGSFLAFIQYGIASEKFRWIENRRIHSIYNPADIGFFAHYLKDIDHSAGYFISNRIRKIAQRNAKNLSETQQRLLAEMAAMF